MIERLELARVAKLKHLYNRQSENNRNKADQKHQNPVVAVFAASVDFVFYFKRHLPAPKPVLAQRSLKKQRAKVSKEIV